MARKKGSKALWIDGEIHSHFKKKVEAEGWRWGLTKKLEVILSAYIAGDLDSKALQVHPTPGKELGGHGTPSKEKERRHGQPRIWYWKKQLKLATSKSRLL